MKVGGLDFISFISMFIPVVVILISIVLGYLFNKKLELNKEINSKKRKIYEDFLAAITLVLFEGGLTLLIDPSKEYPMKEVHETKISVINGYEKIKLWGSEGVVNACHNLFQEQINIAKETDKTVIAKKQDALKATYYNLIFEMRKDLKMNEIKIDKNNIQIITMSRDDIY